MSNESKRRRKLEVERVREEGRQAALAGKHAQTNPYGNDMNSYQWFQGYRFGELELEAREAELAK